MKATLTQQPATHIDSRRQAALTSQQEVCERLAWGELYYCNYKYRAGLLYAEERFLPKTADLLLRSARFWKWWRVQWTLREEAFLLQNLNIHTVSLLRANYREMHKPQTLIYEMFLDEHALHAMLGEGAKLRESSPDAPNS